MINTYKDEQGRVIGYVEWRQVGQSGYEKPYGEYVWVNELWIHGDYKDGRKIMKNLIDQVLLKSIGAEFCYFQRKKYNNRLSKLYTREDFERILMKGALSVIS